MEQNINRGSFVWQVRTKDETRRVVRWGVSALSIFLSFVGKRLPTRARIKGRLILW